MKGHILNLWNILPGYLTDKENEILSKSLDACYGYKEKVRGADYRLSTIVVYSQMKDHTSRRIIDLLQSLMLVTKLAYLPASKRCPRIVLLTYNTTFKHAVSVINVLGKKGRTIK